MVYLAKSGRTYDIPDEVFEEIQILKAQVSNPPPDQIVRGAREAQAASAAKGGKA